MSNKPKKSIGTVLIVIGVMLIMAALGLVMYNKALPARSRSCSTTRWGCPERMQKR